MLTFNIQSGHSKCEIGNAAREPVPTKNKRVATFRADGFDKVSLSTEALSFSRGASQTSLTEGENIELDKNSKQTQIVSNLRATRLNILSLLLEKLFLTELDENLSYTQGGYSDSSDNEGKQNSQIKSLDIKQSYNNQEVAEVKQMINDFISGKIGLSDIPQNYSTSQGNYTYSKGYIKHGKI
jgi:hypothetical protein